ncbi:MAG: hypothetical protein IJR00_04865 [Lachnospiraceae bacterium]|nr:hypothetical protein [Lachnospiraceae bacterium]
MQWKKGIAGVVVTVLFAALNILYIWVYATDFFAAQRDRAGIFSGVYLAMALVAAVLLTWLCKRLMPRVREMNLADESVRKYSVWVSVAAVTAGCIYLLYSAYRAPAENNVLYHVAVNRSMQADMSLDIYQTRERLYIVIIGSLMQLTGTTARAASIAQVLLYIIAAMMMFTAVRILAGRVTSVIAVIAMFFFPMFSDMALLDGEDVIFWLLLSAGMLASALFAKFAADIGKEYPPTIKFVTAAFTGLFIGMVIGWDGGLFLLVLIPVYVFFLPRVRIRQIALLFVTLLIGIAFGYVLCVTAPGEWWLHHFSAFTLEMPRALTVRIGWFLALVSLGLLSVGAFFVRKKRENITLWMIFCVYAAFFAQHIAESGVSSPAFTALVYIVLLGVSVTTLLTE